MLPEPLHPAVVHFPVVLVILLPIFALVALWAIRRGAPARRSWMIPVAVAAALALSSFAALRTGQVQEERVEELVPERAIEHHEESAERFLVLSGILCLVMVAGLAGGSLGSKARTLGTAGALGLVIAGAQVGASGGELVYRHGAAQAYANGAQGSTLQTAIEVPHETPGEEREREGH